MLTGVLAGFAAGVKYTGALVPVALVILLWRESWRHIIQFCLTTALVAAPWYLRNLVFTGNPFYPFFLGEPIGIVFAASGTADLARIAEYSACARHRSVGCYHTWNRRQPKLCRDHRPAGADADSAALVYFSIADLDQGLVLRRLLIFSGILYLFWAVGIAGSKLLLQTDYCLQHFPSWRFWLPYHLSDWRYSTSLNSRSDALRAWY